MICDYRMKIWVKNNAKPRPSERGENSTIVRSNFGYSQIFRIDHIIAFQYLL